MNATQLLRHYERIADAPDAVGRMRRFILELAVRGKLVPQDPQEEPAAELLRQIAAERALMRLREFPRASALPDVDKAPYDLPPSWAWTRVREISSDRGQRVPQGPFTYIDVTAINKEIGVVAGAKVMTADQAPSRARKVTKKGDVLYSCVRPYLLNVAVIEQDFEPTPIASTAFAVLNGHGLVLPRYIWITLRSPFMVACVEANMRGQAYPAINDGDFALLPFPLPPLAEQHRIVAKVDELMALCDRLEAARTQREATRDRLTAASLARLNAPDPETFHADVRFALDALTALTARPDQIKQLRQSILNLAVLGRLVAQNSNDEPGSELLKQIAAEKARLLKAGLIPRAHVASRDPSRPRGVLPDSWEVIALGEACSLVTSGSRGWAEFYADAGPGFVRAQNIRFGTLRLDELAFVNPPTKAEGSRTQIAKGDLLIVITGAGVTNPALVEQDLGEAYVSQHVGLARPVDHQLSEWLLLCLMAPAGGRDELVERAYGSGKPGLNLDNVRSLSVPVPPLVEQRRIVLKVKELMALCDRLAASIGQGENCRGRLLGALLQDALAPAVAFKEAA